MSSREELLYSKDLRKEALNLAWVNDEFDVRIFHHFEFPVFTASKNCTVYEQRTYDQYEMLNHLNAMLLSFGYL